MKTTTTTSSNWDLKKKQHKDKAPDTQELHGNWKEEKETKEEAEGACGSPSHVHKTKLKDKPHACDAIAMRGEQLRAASAFQASAAMLACA